MLTQHILEYWKWLNLLKFVIYYWSWLQWYHTSLLKPQMKICWLIIFQDPGTWKIYPYLSSTGCPDHFDTQHAYEKLKIKIDDSSNSGILEMVKFIEIQDLHTNWVFRCQSCLDKLRNLNLMTHHFPGSWKLKFLHLIIIC